MKATMTLLGLMTYNPDLWAELVLPESVDKEAVIALVNYEYYQCQVMIPDPYMFQKLVGIWSKKELPIWIKLEETTQYEYDPIYNYDRTEEWWDTGNESEAVNESTTGNSKSTGSGNQSETHEDSRNDNLTQTTDMAQHTDMEHNTRGTDDTVVTGNNNTTVNQTTTNYTTAFNSAPEVMHDKSVVTGTTNEAISSNTGLTRDMRVDDIGDVTDKGTVKNTGNVSSDGTSSGTSSYTDNNDTNSKRGLGRDRDTDSHHYGRMYGNIGVTTTQQMIEAERAVVKFNLTDYIVRAIAREFLILVY